MKKIILLIKIDNMYLVGYIIQITFSKEPNIDNIHKCSWLTHWNRKVYKTKEIAESVMNGINIRYKTVPVYIK